MGSMTQYFAFVDRNSLLTLAIWWLRLWEADKHVHCYCDYMGYKGAGGTWK